MYENINYEKITKELKHRKYEKVDFYKYDTFQKGVSENILYKRVTEINYYLRNLDEKTGEFLPKKHIKNYTKNRSIENSFHGDYTQVPVVKNFTNKLYQSVEGGVSNSTMGSQKFDTDTPLIGGAQGQTDNLCLNENRLYKNFCFDISKLQSLDVLRSDKNNIVIAYDSEWQTINNERKPISWQFALLLYGKLHEYCFLCCGSELSVYDAIQYILNDIGAKSFEMVKGREYFKCCVANGNKQAFEKFYTHSELISNSHRIHRAIVQAESRDIYSDYTIDEDHLNGVINKYSKHEDHCNSWVWGRKSIDFKPDEYIDITLLCHTGKVDLTMFQKHSDGRYPFLHKCSSVQGGVVSMQPMTVLFTSKHESRGHHKYVFPVHLSIRDTMCLSVGDKSLSALGGYCGVPKLDYDDMDKGDMLGYLTSNPCKFVEYAMRDSVTTLVYASKLFGVNRDLALTLTSVTAKAVKNKMLKYLGCSNSEFESVYRGVHKVGKGKIKSHTGMGYLDVSNVEPINHDTERVQKACEHAFCGGYNASFNIGWISHTTYDFDLKGAYSQAMMLVPDIDWCNPITREISDTVVTLDDFKSNGVYNRYGLFYVTFTFPENVLYPNIGQRCGSSLIFTRENKDTDGTWVTANEVILALHLGATVFCKKGYFLRVRKLSDGSNSYSLRNAILEMTQDRETAKSVYGKKSMQDLLLKLMINGSYGKTAQNVVQKNTWNAYKDVMENIGCSSITNPFVACYITSFIRCCLLASLNQLHDHGYQSDSVTTDGFISDCSLEVLHSLDLYGFSDELRKARGILTGGSDTSYYEIKHIQNNGYLNLCTRGNCSPDVEGVCAHNSLKTPYYKGTLADRQWFIHHCLTRTGKVVYTETDWTGFKALVHGSSFVVTEREAQKSMDFDYKRMIDFNSVVNTPFSLYNNSYSVANYTTKPFTNLSEYKSFKELSENVTVLRTVDDLRVFELMLKHNTSSKKVLKDINYKLLWSMFVYIKLGRLNVDFMSSADYTLSEKIGIINSLGVCNKTVTINDWKNASRTSRHHTALPLDDVIDFLGDVFLPKLQLFLQKIKRGL